MMQKFHEKVRGEKTNNFITENKGKLNEELHV